MTYLLKNRLIAFALVAAMLFALMPISAFAADEVAQFKVGSDTYTDLNDAVQAAVSGSVKTIILANDGTLPVGDYTIPNGVTLLIPFDTSGTLYRDTPARVSSHTTPTAFRILTMPKDSSITVESGGAISLSGKASYTGTNTGSWNGTPTGPDGRINMLEGSNITIKDGANLYVWGYIYGSGEVVAESGASVYEMFQIRSWRGGNASTTANSAGIFPFNQYYVQNIEVPLKIYAGAKEILYTSINTSFLSPQASVEFIGENGMFQLTDGYLVKDYIEASDRLDIQIFGDSQLGALKLAMSSIGLSIDTSNYELPLTNNLSVTVQKGTTKVIQDIALLPGVELNIAQDATLLIDEQSNVIVYDSEDWVGKHYATASTDLNVVGYSVANGTTVKRDNSSLVDATVDINGTVKVLGGFYTKENGSNVTSSQKTGTILYASYAEESVSHKECTQSSNVATTVYVPMTRAYIKTDTGYVALIDDTGEYNFTSGGTVTFTEKIAVQWYDYFGEKIMDASLYAVGETPVYIGSVPTVEPNKEYYYSSCIGWSSLPEEDEAEYALDGDFPAIEEEDTSVEYYAVHTSTPFMYKVQWLDGNNVLKTSDTTYRYSDIPLASTYDGIAPAKAPMPYAYNKNYRRTEYTFNNNKWTSADDLNQHIRTYTAGFDSNTTYAVYWNDADGTELFKKYYAVNTPVSSSEYEGSVPSNCEDGYTFIGWDKESVTANSNYTLTSKIFTAKYAKIFNKHSLTLDDGKVGVSFYTVLPSGYTKDNVTADFSWGNKYISYNTYDPDQPYERTVTGSDFTLADGTECVKFTVYIAAKELNDEITVSLKSGGSEIASETYKAADYAQSIISGENDTALTERYTTEQITALKDLCTALLNYSAYAQKNFEYNTDNLATDAELTELTADELSGLAAGISEFNADGTGLVYYGTSLNLGSDTAYSFYFFDENGTAATNVSYTLDGDEAVTIDVDDMQIQVDTESDARAIRFDIAGIPSAKVLKDITLTVNGAAQSVNIGSYIKNVLTDSSNEKLRDVVTALYRYGKAAESYFGKVNVNA